MGVLWTGLLNILMGLTLTVGCSIVFASLVSRRKGLSESLNKTME
jgi:hypothetical protein